MSGGNLEGISKESRRFPTPHRVPKAKTAAMARGRRPRPAAAPPSFGTQTFVENLRYRHLASLRHRRVCALLAALARRCGLRWCIHAAASNYLHGTAVVCLRRAVLDATTTRRVHEGTARSTLRSGHHATQIAMWRARAHGAIWPVLPSAQRRPKSGKNESGLLPGFQLTRTDSPVRLAVY